MAPPTYKQQVSAVLSLHVDREGETVFVRLAGELDLAAEVKLGELLADLTNEVDTHCVILDMRQVSFLDSSGLRILLVQEMRSRREGFDFALIPPRGEALRALEIAGVHQLIELRGESGRPPSEAAKAAQRASAGIGTGDDDPSEWLSQSEPVRDEGDLMDIY